MTALGDLAWTILGESDGNGSLNLTRLHPDESTAGEAPSVSCPHGSLKLMSFPGATVRFHPTSILSACVFAVAANQNVSNPSIAIASSQGVVAIVPTPPAYNRISFPPSHSRYSGHRSDALAVAYISDNVLAGGHRNGMVWLYDVRVSDQALRIQHSSSVTNIKVIDGNRLLVAGLQNQVSFNTVSRAVGFLSGPLFEFSSS
jgi:hypothetical protein